MSPIYDNLMLLQIRVFSSPCVIYVQKTMRRCNHHLNVADTLKLVRLICRLQIVGEGSGLLGSLANLRQLV
jgi:hypothetical protein